MFLISHRGNTSGKIPELENRPSYIVQALHQGFDVEIDIWFEDNNLYLGHDSTQYLTSLDFINLYKERLWIHCKNLESVSYFYSINTNGSFNFFWHEQDKITITSKKFLWAYPGIFCGNSIAVLPEIYNDSIDNRVGICSDFINNFI